MSESLKHIHSGYIGTPEKWVKFMSIWSQIRIDSYDQLTIDDNMPQDRSAFTVLSDAKMKHNIELIGMIEDKHGIQLPKSYRDFMIVANENTPSWLMSYCLGGDSEYELSWYAETVTQWFSLTKFGRFEEQHSTISQDLIDIYEILAFEPSPDYEYYEYYNELVDINASRYSKNMILLGEGRPSDTQTFVLLQPDEVTKDGEWECYAMEVPDLCRYRSFADYLICGFIRQTIIDYGENPERKEQYAAFLADNHYDLLEIIQLLVDADTANTLYQYIVWLHRYR